MIVVDPIELWLDEAEQAVLDEGERIKRPPVPWPAPAEEPLEPGPS